MRDCLDVPSASAAMVAGSIGPSVTAFRNCSSSFSSAAAISRRFFSSSSSYATRNSYSSRGCALRTPPSAVLRKGYFYGKGTRTII